MTAKASSARTAALIALPIVVLAGLGLVTVLTSAGSDGTAPGKPQAEASGPVAIAAPPAVSPAVAAQCGKAIGALPIVLDGQHSRSVSTAPDRVVAWGRPAVVLRCGVAAVRYPADATLLTINGVSWYGRAVGQHVVFTSVDRTIPIEVAVPAARKGNPSDSIATLSTPLGRSIPAAKTPAAPTPGS